LIFVDSGQTRDQVGTSKEGAKPLLEAQKAGMGEDGFLFDKFFSKRRENHGLGHINDGEDGETLYLKILRRKDLAEYFGLGKVLQKSGDIHGLSVKGHKDPHEVAFPKRGWKDKISEPLDQVFVAGDKRKILDGTAELRDLIEQSP
jgi:hypothetical protein